MKHFLVPENVFAAVYQNLCSQRYDLVEGLVVELRKCKAVQLNETPKKEEVRPLNRAERRKGKAVEQPAQQ